MLLLVLLLLVVVRPFGLRWRAAATAGCAVVGVAAEVARLEVAEDGEEGHVALRGKRRPVVGRSIRGQPHGLHEQMGRRRVVGVAAGG